MEQEVAYQRDKMIRNSGTNVFSQPARGSFRHDHKTLELTMTENQHHEPVGFSIEKAVMTQKQQKANIQDLVADDVVALSSKTKEKIGKSALSRLDQQLMDFKPNSDGGSSEGPVRGSHGITPEPRAANDTSDLRNTKRPL